MPRLGSDYRTKVRMESRKKSLRAIAALCDEIGPEDGEDPRRITRRRAGAKKERKAKQVSKQAEVTVQLAMGALLDEAFRELRVVRVEPAPDSRRLLVVIGPRFDGTRVTEHHAAEIVRKAEPLLRRDVAAALHRKRAPSLVFRFVGMAEGERDED